MIDRMALANTKFLLDSFINPSGVLMPARIKENSPICAKLTEIVKAVRSEFLNILTISQAAIDFPKTTIISVPKTEKG